MRLKLCPYSQCILYVFVQIHGKVLAPPSKLSQNFNGVNFHKSMVTSKLFVLGVTFLQLKQHLLPRPDEHGGLFYTTCFSIYKMVFNPNFCYCGILQCLLIFTWKHVLKNKCNKQYNIATVWKIHNFTLTSVVYTLIYWFHGIFGEISVLSTQCHTVEITEFYCHLFDAKTPWK